MPLRSAAEIEALKQKLPLLPLHKLRVKELQAAAFGLVGIRGKLKSVVVESIRKYLAAAPVEDGLAQQMVVGKFAFGPVRAVNDSRFHIASAAPSYDALGRSCKHLLVVTALDPVSLGPLLRVPDGARIFLDGRAVRIPSSRVCAWDVSRITLRGRRCPSVELVVAFNEPAAVVAAAVVEARSQLEDAAPMRALRFGVAHPAAAVLAMRSALRGSMPMPAIAPAGSGASLSSAETVRQSIASTGVLRGPTLWAALSLKEMIRASKTEERRRLRKQPDGSAVSHATATAAGAGAGTGAGAGAQPGTNGIASTAAAAGAAGAGSNDEASDSDSDDDVMGTADEAVRVADPFRLNAIGVPVRGSDCKHLSVFDAKTFEALSAHSSSPQARSCPFCKQPLRLEDLRVDSALAAVLAAVRGGATSGVIEDTVAAAFHQPGAVGPSLAAPELHTLLQAGSGVSSWLNAEDGVAVDKSRVHSVRLGADGSWQAVGLDGKDLAPMAQKRPRSQSEASAEGAALARRSGLAGSLRGAFGAKLDDEDDDDEDDEEEELRRLVDELAGRSSGPEPVTPAAPTPSARNDEEEDVIDLT